jgi:hypothetical protein
VRVHEWAGEVIISMYLLCAKVVAPAKIFVLAAGAIGYPVGLGVVTHPGSHFSPIMLMNLRGS